MKKIILLLFLLIYSLAIIGQDTTFNKLIKSYPGTLGIRSLLKNNTNYYVFISSVDTPFVAGIGYKYNFGILKFNSQFTIIDSCMVNVNKPIVANNGHGFDINNNDTTFIYVGNIKIPNSLIEKGYLVKFDKNLDTLWTRQIAHPDTAYADTAATPWVALRDVKVTPSGDYIIVGNYNYHCQGNHNRSFIIKMNSSGGIIWYRLLTNNIDYGFVRVIEIDPLDSGFYFNSNRSLSKADKNGIIIWNTIINHQPNPANIAEISLLNDNTIIFGSVYWKQPIDSYTYLLLNITSIDRQTHTINWEKTFPNIKVSSAWLNQETIDIEITSSGNIAVGTVGVKYENIQFTADHRANILLLNPQGQELWSRYYTYSDNSMGAENMQFNDMVVCPDGGFLFGGDRAHGALFLDAWLVKTDSMGYSPHAYTVSIEQNELIIAKNKLSIYPNPATDNINLGFEQSPNEDMQLSIYNSAGQLVLSKQLNGYVDTYRVNVEAFALGVYFVRLSSDNKILFSSKFVKR